MEAAAHVAVKNTTTPTTPPSYDSNADFMDLETALNCTPSLQACNISNDYIYIDTIYDYVFPHTTEWILIVINFIVLIIGLLGNFLVCYVVYRNISMQSVTNIFIVNLAVADFCVLLICLPPTVVWDVTETWFFGTMMCKLTLYFQVSCTINLYSISR
ncbi:G protein-coupled receptor rhodopsin-like [Trinorchestia longiramus]|nr:G protein-coupled receptor rhodopsin-like [Trinorchestia longiramus]